MFAKSAALAEENIGPYQFALYELRRGKAVFSHRNYFAALCGVAVLAISANAAIAGSCAPKSADPVDAVRQMYVAAMAGNHARTVAAFASDGYLFDGGARFTPDGIADFVVKAEAAGLKPRWAIEEPESHVTCDFAWATWTNRGTFTTAAGVEPKLWLESAVLVWQHHTWKIRFFHSTAVQPAH